MAKIDDLKDLPKWFDLTKYREVGSFEASDWYRALQIRQGAMSMVREDKLSGNTAAYAPSVGARLERLRSSPLNTTSNVSLFFIHAHDVASPSRMPVRSITTHDLIEQGRHDRAAAEDGYCDALLAKRWDLMADPEISWSDELNALASTALELRDYVSQGSPSAVAVVDLNATDSVLIDAFSTWLKELRAKQPTRSPRKRERPAYEKWASYGLLPYLDLCIWSEETDTQIPQHVLAEAVGYRKGGDSFRKTVLPLAEKLMQNLAELGALVVTESKTRGPTSSEGSEG